MQYCSPMRTPYEIVHRPCVLWPSVFLWLNQSYCQHNVVVHCPWIMNYLRGLGRVNFARGSRAQQCATPIQYHGEVEWVILMPLHIVFACNQERNLEVTRMQVMPKCQVIRMQMLHLLVSLANKDVEVILYVSQSHWKEEWMSFKGRPRMCGHHETH